MTALESPIVGLTFRVRELGRLRMGQKVPTANGRSRPAKLETFRLTSTDWRLIQRASELYGGKPERWEEAPNKRQFQVVVEHAAIPVRIPDDLNWSQAMEAWTAAKCIRRCNGEAMETGEACQCREEMEEGRPAICKPYTRVNLILPELPGWGFWRLESHGWEAAREFIPMVVLAARVAPQETYWLRLDPRTKKGEENGKPVTYQYHVPVLDTDRTPAELYQLQASYMAGTSPAIEAPDPGDAAPPRGLTSGSGLTSEAGRTLEEAPSAAGSVAGSNPASAVPASDLNASVTAPGLSGGGDTVGTSGDDQARRARPRRDTSWQRGEPSAHQGQAVNREPTAPARAAEIPTLQGGEDVNAPGDTARVSGLHSDASAGQEPRNTEASTSPASSGDDRPGRDKRESGSGKPGKRTPAGPAQAALDGPEPPGGD